MGDALSRECGDEPSDAPAVLPPPAPVSAAPAPATVNRRRVKGTPMRVTTAASSGSSGGSGGKRKGRKQKKQKAQQVAPAPAGPAAQPPASAPAPDVTVAEAAAGPPAQPATRAAGCKRKAPEPGNSPQSDAGLAKRHQLLGLAFLTLGTLTRMAPFSLPCPSATPGHAARAASVGGDSVMEEAAAAEEEVAAGAGQAATAGEAAEAGEAATRGGQEAAPAVERQAPEQHEQLAMARRRAAGGLAVGDATTSSPTRQPPPLPGSPELQCPAADLAQEGRAVPSLEQGQQAEQEEAAATPLPPPRLPEQDLDTVEVTSAPPPLACPLSAAKPVSRSQLRQQLLQSQRAAGPAAASQALRSAVHSPAGTPPSAVARSTRGQRLLGLARRKSLPAHTAAAQEASPGSNAPQPAPSEHAEHAVVAAAAAEEGEQMQLDQPEGVAAVCAEQPSMPTAQLAQRRLTQSPLRQPMGAQSTTAPLQQLGAAEASDSGANPIACAAPSEAAVSPQPPPAGGCDATTPQPRRSTPPTPLTADPGSAPRAAPGCAICLLESSPTSPAAQAAGQQPCSSVQSPAANEVAVRAALQQIGALLGDLRGDSPQPPRKLRPCLAAQQPALPCGVASEGPAGGRPAQRVGDSSASAGVDDEVQSALVTALSPPPPPQQQQQAPGAGSPRSPPEVCSRPQEAGADNFPGFWRQPALGCSGSGAAGTGRPLARARKRPPISGEVRAAAGRGGALQDQPACGAAGRERRVRFGESRLVRFALPEADEADEGAANGAPVPAPQQQQQQEPGGPAPLVVAPPVLPVDAGGLGRRPATPAKPAHLPMPQPPAHARLGAVAFRRPYSGPQGRRQALLSFVSEGGATCYAVAPASPPTCKAGGADCSAEQPCGQAAADCGQLLIPRRLQHRGGLRRRSLLPVPLPPQGAELLEQEVREAFINARLADHLSAGDAWARLDMAGCELAPGGQHAEALAQLSGKLEEAQGPGAVQQLLEKLDAEWLHLKRLRQYATQGSAAAAAAAAGNEGEDGAAGSTGRPRGILKHRSSLGGGSSRLGTGTDAVAAAAGNAACAGAPAGGQSPGQPQAAGRAPDQPAASEAAGGPASFEAVLAATIVHELPAAASGPVAPAAAALATEEPLRQVGAGTTEEAAAAVGAGANEEAVPAVGAHTTEDAPAAAAADSPLGGNAAQLDSDAAVVPAPSMPGQPAAAEPCAVVALAAATDPAAGGMPEQVHLAAAATGKADPVPEQASDAPSGMPQPPAAALEAAGLPAGPDQGQPDVLILEPRPVELTPGPELSRGAKMLQRCTPAAAAGKVQQLLQAAGERGRRARASLALGHVKLLPDLGASLAASGQVRRGQSRGERLLASLRGTSGSSVAANSLAARAAGGAGLAEPLGGGVPEGSPQRLLQLPEEGPTVAPAAAVLLGS